MESAGRVLIFIEDGSYTFDNRVRREVKTLEDAGFEVSVICPRYPSEPLAETVGTTHVYRYPKLRFGGPLVSHICEYASSLLFGGILSLWVASRRGFDVIQLCNPPDVIFPIAVFYKILGKKFIFDHHDLCPELYETQYGRRSGLLYRTLVWAERRSLRWADGVISTNESYRRAAMERGGKAPDAVAVVRNGPSLERYSDPPQPRDKRPVRVGYIGNMNQQDGVDYLLRAARHIFVDLGRDDVEFVLIGKGDAFGGLVKLAEEIGVGGRVRFTGRIPDADAFRELCECDIGCQPDPVNPLNSVSTMNKAMEYMALAKPVVAFDLVETRVSCGDAALYAAECTPEALAREILRLADDFELRRSLGLRGRREVEVRLAWTYSEPALLAMYRRVLGDGGGR